MRRRDFIQKAAIGSTLPFWLQGCDLSDTGSFPIEIRSAQSTGHLVRESINWPTEKGGSTETIIVGGGLAGLAAAYSLKGRPFQLFELSDRLGGTASGTNLHGIDICQGAHYDLDYPSYYGEEVLTLLEELEVIEYQPWKKMWSFRDQQHLIPSNRRQQCYDHGKIRGDVIPEGPIKKQFLEIIRSYEGNLPMPTRLTSPELRKLNDVDFLSFLKKQMPVDEAFERQLDYHMMDDYGGKVAQVSALAGLHYFGCRPYYRKHVGLFSPPEGNAYFVKKLANSLPADNLHLHHLVSTIEKSGDAFEVHILDVQNKKTLIWTADRVIYAGQKHALQYVFPEEAHLFEDNAYAPWMVINYVVGQSEPSFGKWQNEYLGEDRSFLGFIDSSVQDQTTLNGHQVLTAYYCLEPKDIAYLSTIADHKQEIVTSTISKIERFLQKRLSVKSCGIHVMGHAMAIPKPGFLFPDFSETKLRYAGVDAGRLPLLFEALDSGLMAAKG